MSEAANRLVREVFERDGILVEHDRELPSASLLVAGEPVAGSWWAHPAAHDIYDALQPLHDEATRVKLVRGKATLVHRRLWPALVAIGRSRWAWQLTALRPDARELCRSCPGSAILEPC